MNSIPFDDQETSQELALRVGSEAVHRVELFERESTLVAHSPSATSQDRYKVLSLSWDQLDVGRLIGQGTFSEVRRATLRINDERLDGGAFALKSLKPSLSTKNKGNFRNGAVDLVLESKILMNLSHKNIIRLVGIKKGSLSESFTREAGGFFLLQELLVETLDTRLVRWQKDNRRASLSSFLRNTKKPETNVLDRLENVALGIVCGMEYLHQHNLVFRDLKPANIGFGGESGDVVKIFDFGFAQEIDPSSKEENRPLTDACGTPRYMAPEVAIKGMQYGLSADVYSFAIVLWELVTLTKPYARHVGGNGTSVAIFHQNVLNNKLRPTLKGIHSKRLTALLQMCWASDPDSRPTFSQIQETLKAEIAAQVAAKTAPPPKRINKLRRSQSAPVLLSSDATISQRGKTENIRRNISESSTQKSSFSSLSGHAVFVSIDEDHHEPLADENAEAMA